jgi:hypothetical protein
VENGLESFASSGAGKDASGEFSPAEMAVRSDNLWPERFSDFDEGRLAWLDDIASQNIRVNDWKAAGAEETRAGRLAHANTAGDSE